MAPKIHYFDTTRNAYNRSQCDDSIKSGDVLVATDEKVVGILYKAWPVALTPNHGSFHGFEQGVDPKVIDGGEFAASVDLANSVKLE